ncbi:MAG: MerR family transcriptional regulator [Thermodesulfobacteriota bacterium]
MKKTTPDLSKYIKMKDLKEKTGLPSSTINYYLRNNLLPEPVKTGKNMAWYPPSTVSRINLIKKLKEKNRLTITEIKEVVNNRKKSDDLYVMETLHEFVFGSISDKLYSFEDFLRLSGLTEEDLQFLTDNKLIIPAAGDFFDETDLFAARSFLRLRELGINSEELTYYSEAAQLVSANEMKLRKKVTQHIPPEKNAEITYELTDIARKFRTYIFERAFQKEVLGNKKTK